MSEKTLTGFQPKREAKIVKYLIGNIEDGDISRQLRLHSSLKSSERLQLVIRNCFDSAVRGVTEEESINNEATLLNHLFPTLPLDNITTLLKDFAYEKNRVRIVIRLLLLDKINRPKRPNSDYQAAYNKKVKIETIVNPSTSNFFEYNHEPNGNLEVRNEHNQGRISPILDNTLFKNNFLAPTIPDSNSSVSLQENSLEVPTTSNFDAAVNLQENSLSVPTITSITSSVRLKQNLLDIPTTSNFTYSINLKEPREISMEPGNPTGSSYVPDSSSNSHEMDSQATIIMTPNNSQPFDFEEQSTNNSILEHQHYVLDDSSYVEAADSDVIVDDYPSCSTSTAIQSAFPKNMSKPTEYPQGNSNPECQHFLLDDLSDVEADDSEYILPYPSCSTSTLTQSASPKKKDQKNSISEPTEYPRDGYNLHKHIQELFSDVSLQVIERTCASFWYTVHVKPPPGVFSMIVSKLLANSFKEVTPATNHTISSPGHILKISQPNSLCASTTNIGNNQLLKHEQSHQVSTVTKSRATMCTPHLSPDRWEAVIKAEQFETVLDDSMEIDDSIIDVDLDDGEMYDSEPEVENQFTINEDTNVYVALISPLMEMFPEACPRYIHNICRGKENTPNVLDDLISEILAFDYPKRQQPASPERIVTVDEQLEIMKQILPDADPTFLQLHCERLLHKPDQMKVFISDLIETRKYPTMKDYLRKQQLSAQQKQYTTEFSVENFLEVIADPVAYFNDPKRKSGTVNYDSYHYALSFLRNHYPKIPLTKIRETFKKHKSNFLQTCKELDNPRGVYLLKTKRLPCRMPELSQDIPLLQQIAYIENFNKIQEYHKQQKLKEQQEREDAKANGLLYKCGCCYDDEVMLKDIYTCENGCEFCRSCVQKGVEISYGDGKLDFLCLDDCSSHFSLQTLQAVLKPKMFSIIALKKQVEEVKAAGIEDLEVCPFCDFATIPARDDKLFRCLNPECMKESCRSCKEPSHVPLRCEEVEKEDDVKRRTYIENKMTEALLRKCYKCGLKFIKADGCNRMTCSCGALMCYICGKAVADYKHFNGSGGNRFDLCPLYSDTNKLHETDVLEGASKAKQEMGVDKDARKLKNDPTLDIKRHYQAQASNNPVLPDEMRQLLFDMGDDLHVRQLQVYAQRGLGYHRHRHQRHRHRQNEDEDMA